MKKLNRRTKEALGISMMISAFSMTIAFLVLAVRKRSFLAAFSLLAAAEGTAGLWLLLDGRSTPKKVCRACETEQEEEELFDEEECRVANAHIRSVLGGDDEDEGGLSVREVPRDEDATEADFG